MTLFINDFELIDFKKEYEIYENNKIIFKTCILEELINYYIILLKNIKHNFYKQYPLSTIYKNTENSKETIIKIYNSDNILSSIKIVKNIIICY
jgi:hypothetical protein